MGGINFKHREELGKVGPSLGFNMDGYPPSNMVPTDLEPQGWAVPWRPDAKFSREVKRCPTLAGAKVTRGNQLTGPNRPFHLFFIWRHLVPIFPNFSDEL